MRKSEIYSPKAQKKKQKRAKSTVLLEKNAKNTDTFIESQEFQSKNETKKAHKLS
jgi:hypothetical protein